MIKYFICILLCMLTHISLCQEGNYKRAEQFIRGGESEKLIFSTVVSPVFLKNSEKFWFKYKTSDGEQYYFVDPKAKLKMEMFNRDFIATELSRLTHKPLNAIELPLRNITFDEDEKTMKFQVDTNYVEYNIFTKRLIKVTKPIPAATKPLPLRPKPLFGKYSPDSMYVAYTKSHNLYVMSVKDTTVEIQLTTDGAPGFSYCIAENDSSSQKRETIAEWFKNSNQLYAIRSDLRHTKMFSLLNSVGAGSPKVTNYRFAKPGDRPVTYDMSVFDAEVRKQIKVSIEKWTDQSLTLVYAGEKHDKVYVQRKKEPVMSLKYALSMLKQVRLR